MTDFIKVPRKTLEKMLEAHLKLSKLGNGPFAREALWPIRALLDAPSEPMPVGWQPIETAPKDGTDILGMYMHIETQIVHNIFWLDNEYEPDENGWWTYEYSEVSRMKLEDWMTPTHWMPLPDTPKGEQQ